MRRGYGGPKRRDLREEEPTSSQSSTTVGIDLGDRYIHLCALDTKSGEEVVEESRVPTNPRASEGRFAGRKRMRVAVEAGTHSTVEDDIRALASFTAVCLALLLGLSLCGVLLCITFSGLFETADEKWLRAPKALVAAICLFFFTLVLTFVDQALLIASGKSLAQWLVILEVPALVVGF